MVTHDTQSHARNKRIAEMGAQLKAMLPAALATGIADNELSLHATYGGKHAHFIDIKHAVIHTPEQFVNLWLEGYMNYLTVNGRSKGAFLEDWAYYKNFIYLQRYPELWRYVELFLMRTFLRQYEALARNRPTVDKSTIWIGDNKASYGLLVTPRFSGSSGKLVRKEKGDGNSSG